MDSRDSSDDEQSVCTASFSSSPAKHTTSSTARNTCNNETHVSEINKNYITNTHTESAAHTHTHAVRDAAREAVQYALNSPAHSALSFPHTHTGIVPPTHAQPPLTHAHTALPHNPLLPFAAPPTLPYNMPSQTLPHTTQLQQAQLSNTPAQSQFGLLIASLALSPLLALSLLSACAAQPWFSELAVSLKRVFDTQRETLREGLRENESESATRCVAIALQNTMHSLQEKQLSVLWSVLGAQSAQIQAQAQAQTHSNPVNMHAQTVQPFQHTHQAQQPSLSHTHRESSVDAQLVRKQERTNTQYNDNTHKITAQPHLAPTHSTQQTREPAQTQLFEERSLLKERSSFDLQERPVHSKVDVDTEDRSSLSKIDFDPDEYYARSAERSSAGPIASIYMVPSYKRSASVLTASDEKDKDRDAMSVNSTEREKESERETYSVKRQKIVSPYMVNNTDAQSETNTNTNTNIGAQNNITSPYMVGSHNAASHTQSQNITSPYMVGSHNTSIQSPYMVGSHNTTSHSQSRNATSPYMVSPHNAPIQSPYMVGAHTSPYMASTHNAQPSSSSSNLSFSPYFFSHTHAQNSHSHSHASPSHHAHTSQKPKTTHTPSYASASSLSLNSKISFYAWDGLLVEVLKHPHPELAVPPSLLPPFPADAAKFVRIFSEEENRHSLLFPQEIEVLQRLVVDKETLDKEVNALRLHALHHQKKADLYKPRFGWEYLKEQLRYGRSQMLCTLYWCVCVVHLYHMPQYEALKMTREQFVHKYIESQRHTQRSGSSHSHANSNSNSAWRTQSSSASASLFMDIDEMELQRLVQFRNILKVAMVILPAHRNEVLLLRVATCLERSGKKYQISSSGQMLATTRRRLIYRREGLASLSSSTTQTAPAPTTNESVSAPVSVPAPLLTPGVTSMYMATSAPVPAVSEGMPLSLLKSEESEEPLSFTQTHTHTARTDMESSASPSSSSSLGMLSAPVPPVAPLPFPTASLEREGREDEEDLNSLSENQPEVFSQE